MKRWAKEVAAQACEVNAGRRSRAQVSSYSRRAAAAFDVHYAEGLEARARARPMAVGRQAGSSTGMGTGTGPERGTANRAGAVSVLQWQLAPYSSAPPKSASPYPRWPVRHHVSNRLSAPPLLVTRKPPLLICSCAFHDSTSASSFQVRHFQSSLRKEDASTDIPSDQSYTPPAAKAREPIQAKGQGGEERDSVGQWEWEPMIGVEVHAQLASKQKLFSRESCVGKLSRKWHGRVKTADRDCLGESTLLSVKALLFTAYLVGFLTLLKFFSISTSSCTAGPTASPLSTPNTLVAPFDAALPGALPQLSTSTLSLAVRAALALGCRISLRSSWDRKHYFYPDLTTGWQVTQKYCES